MTHALIDAAEQLAAALVAENAALEAMDFPLAATLLAGKAAAAATFTAAQAAGEAMPPALLGRAQELGRALETLAQANRGLLERAITVQGRVIGIVAGAARQAAPMPGYGVGGRPATSGRAAAYALVARA